MGRNKAQAEPEEESGAPEWMVTFSDCMTLLLTFFVLLLTFSSFDVAKIIRLRAFFTAQPSTALSKRRVRDAFLRTQQLQPTPKLDDGSEKPTLETGKEDGLKEETEPEDFRSRKVILIPSKSVFWGKGTRISTQGRRILSDMASLVKEIPNRIVICESGLEDGVGVGRFGLPRAWAVLEHLTTEQGLDKKRFSLSAASLARQGVGSDEPGDSTQSNSAKSDRLLEIVFLERSIYN
jgi:chemotaxis protein MotB